MTKTQHLIPTCEGVLYKAPYGYSVGVQAYPDTEQHPSIVIGFDVPVEICKARNRMRTGRELVPDSVIDNMTKGLTKPTYGFDEVWTINSEGRRLS